MASQVPFLSWGLTLPLLVVLDIVSGTKYVLYAVAIIMATSWQTLSGLFQFALTFPVPWMVGLTLAAGSVLYGIAMYVVLVKATRHVSMIANSRVKAVLRTLRLIRGRYF